MYSNYVSQFGLEDLVYDYLITSQKECHSFPDMDFLLHLCLFCPNWSYLGKSYPMLQPITLGF